MAYVILGHGGLDPVSTSKMEWCALSAGTTLQFYADAGQALMQNPGTTFDFASLEQPWPPVTAAGVTYNLKLEPLTDAERDSLLSKNPDFGGHTLVLVGRDLEGAPQLCTGDPTTCPSDPRMITGDAEGPTEHTCDGVLKNYAGEDVIWLCCTVIQDFDDETQAAVTAARGDAPSGVYVGADPDSAIATAQEYLRRDPAGFEGWFDGLGQDEKDVLLRDEGMYAWNQGRNPATAEWVPSDADFQAVSDVNQPYVKDLDQADEGTWEVGGFLVLLGPNHGYADWVRGRDDHASGTFRVERTTFGAGSLVFSGVPAPHQGTITSAVGQFSDKDVEFE